MDRTPRLTKEQDGMLRRLTFFERTGMRLAPGLREMRYQLRSLDHRTEVREPWENRVTPRGDDVAQVGGAS
jgi:hypothetical protein